MVYGEIESESVLTVGVGVDHLEVCPGLSIAEMFPLDQRYDCQVSGLAPDCPLCQQTNVPVRCWDTKIEIFIEILQHLTFIKNMILILTVLVDWPVLPPIQRGLLVDSREVGQSWFCRLNSEGGRVEERRAEVEIFSFLYHLVVYKDKISPFRS